MSSLPASQVDVQDVRPHTLSAAGFAALASAFSVLGLISIWPAAMELWAIWSTDAMKSVGMAVPIVSLVLILRVWRKLRWQAEGSWWGLFPIFLAMMLSWLKIGTVIILVISPHWATPLPPPSLVLFAYGSGVVLLFGGMRLFRAALFPILLLLLANPIPHEFELLIDLPLQTASAHIARSLAMSLGQTLTPDHLRLMFAPDFGMFIAPGCNGIRGSVTMGYIALIAGYMYRFRWHANALIVMGAILLGYFFNLVRLCLLVVYYMVALHFTSLQNKAANADYLIGAALFLVASLILFEIIHRFRDMRGSDRSDSTADRKQSEIGSYIPRVQYARLGAMGAVLLFGYTGLARTFAVHPSAEAIAAATAERFPSRLGTYNLVRSWKEALTTGQVVYQWAEYSPPDGGAPLAIGVSPFFNGHDPLICHTVRGDSPRWQGQLTFVDASVVPVSFSSALYNDGVNQYLEASTQCSEASCDEFATKRTHFGLVYSRPNADTLLSGDRNRLVPVLLRVETANALMPSDVAREQLTGDLRSFLASVRLSAFTRPFSH